MQTDESGTLGRCNELDGAITRNRPDLGVKVSSDSSVLKLTVFNPKTLAMPICKSWELSEEIL